jgi:hypothetical protein
MAQHMITQAKTRKTKRGARSTKTVNSDEGGCSAAMRPKTSRTWGTFMWLLLVFGSVVYRQSISSELDYKMLDVC